MSHNFRCADCQFAAVDPDNMFCAHIHSLNNHNPFGLSVDNGPTKECGEDTKYFVMAGDITLASRGRRFVNRKLYSINAALAYFDDFESKAGQWGVGNIMGQSCLVMTLAYDAILTRIDGGMIRVISQVNRRP